MRSVLNGRELHIELPSAKLHVNFLQKRPEMTRQKTAGYQQWRHLLFAHWRVPVAAIQHLLPDGLQVEEFDGTAWVGLVPFAMNGIRPWWSPPVPGISWFLETNVRTYVCDEHGNSGVWFFSLDANKQIAVKVARTFWHLNYVFADLQLSQSEHRFHFSGRRRQNPEVGYEIQCDVIRESVRTAQPGTVEFFLLERYTLFAANRHQGQLSTGQVHHEPYQYCDVASLQCEQTLISAAGIPMASHVMPDHVVWSPGVDVVVSALQRLS